MPPKKNNTDLTQKVVKKRIRKVKPVKPPLKTPLLIRLQVSNLDSESPKFTRKIDLANAVARAQLVKSTNDPPMSVCSPVVNSPEPVKKSTTNRKKKITPKIEKSESYDTSLAQKATKEKPSETIEYVPGNKPKRTRKSSAKAPENEAPDLTFKSPAKRKLCKNIESDTSESEALEPKIKRPGPKSRTTLQTRKKMVAKQMPETIEPETKAKNGVKKGQQKVISDFFCDRPINGTIVEPEEVHKTPAKRVYKRKLTPKIAANKKKDSKKVDDQPITRRTRGKPRSKFVSERSDDKSSSVPATRGRPKGKVLSAQEIKTAASKLEDALGTAQVVTRPNSVNSSNSNLSWTRDISTASNTTTTCITVSSNDFVRYDKKLPIVHVDNTLNLKGEEQIKAIEDKANSTEEGVKTSLLENEESSSSDSSSSESTSSSSDTSSDSEIDVPVSNPELNLSTSSLTLKSQEPELIPNNIELLCLALDNLNTSLENFNSEVGKFVEWDENDFSTFIKALESMNLERDLIRDCKNYDSILDSVTRIASPDKTSQSDRAISRSKDGEVTGLNGTCEDSISEGSSPRRSGQMDLENETRPCSIRRTSITKNRDKYPVNINVPAVSEILNYPVKGKNQSGSSDTFTSDNHNYVSFDKTYDDEDALSLFAESITGIESSIRGSVASVSNVSNHDVYVPQPTKPWQSDKYVYTPTRIKEVPVKTIEPNMIKKQNADSSSISKDTSTYINKKAMDLKDANMLSSLAQDSVRSPQQCFKRLFSLYQPITAVKSSLYRGYCFFNLSSTCKNANCRFPHNDVDKNLLKCRLTLLHEDDLIQEYLLTRNFKTLRHKFISFFVEECKRRKSTRILMEMAIDLGLGFIERDDANLITKVLETTLLHLNTISFDACDDLLKYEFNNFMLCDVLLVRMSNSQNFAQFKQAFVKLANFMWEIKRPVDIDVVGNILERVCILPGEEYLARGMLTLMQNTDPIIFENNMAKSFEVQLSNIESDAFEAYLLAKKAALTAQLENFLVPENCGDNDGPPHMPPDTTTLDSLKKAQMAQPTTFKCTINTDAIPGSEAIRDLFKSPNPVPKQRYTIPNEKNWPSGRYPIRHQRGVLRVRSPTGAIRGGGNARIMTSGRRVHRTQTHFRNGPNI